MSSAHDDPSFHHADRNVLVQPGWIPATDIPILEQLREEHERLIAQRDEVLRRMVSLQDGFAQEDKDRQDALDLAYRHHREPELPPMTAESDRRALLKEAEAHRAASVRALLIFGYDAVDRLRGELPESWHAADATNMHRIPPNGNAAEVAALLNQEWREQQERLAEADRMRADADQRIREMQPLRTWLIRTANAGTDGAPRLLTGRDLPVPASHTPMTKPRDLSVPGWWPDVDPAHGRQEVVGSDPSFDTQAFPEDAEEGTVDLSDPWFVRADRPISTKEL